ncbi:hypothetical protein O7635_37785 [Asanoa sp. WMMD1127]|uniref:hypothetical protein n=1 Tax=Asanoa sp. WMMD1127 TaxID=3016107 RepID=UPI002415FE5E|nr:hypothetical protein [Asanoa sp. WMMD1127]MDG4827628.1 hypothetical protein [Asanoa sp. WMMD1127]
MTVRRLTAQFAAAGDLSGRPFYARVLRLRHINPSSTVCFVFLEGATAFAIILALAELIPLWGVVLLPVCIAAMVKINDLVAGAAVRAAAHREGRASVRRPMRPFRTVGRAQVPGGAGAEKVGRVYRSAPPSPAAPPTATAAADAGLPVLDTDDWADDDDLTDTAERRHGSHGGAIPVARQANTATAVNAPPIDLQPGRPARAPSGRDVVDTPAQRARHAATRRYE